MNQPEKLSWRRQQSGGDRSWVFGRREVIELLDSGLEIVELLLLQGGEGDTYDQIRARVERRNIPLRRTERSEFDRHFPGEVHQGVAASYRPRDSAGLSEILAAGIETGRPLVLLDGIEDPHNVGAVIRSAEVFGAIAVVIPGRRAAGITPAVVKSSAGAALRLPVVSVGNLAQAIREAKKAGFWIYGLDMAGETTIYEESFDGAVGIVLGSEGHGLARLTRDLCDGLIRIPQEGKLGSLNVSASAAICLSELLRRRPQVEGKG